MTADLLLELAWKSAVVCGGVLLLLQAARGHSPAQRARLAFAGIALVPLLPMMSLLLPPIALSTGVPSQAALPAQMLMPATMTPMSIATVAPVAEPSAGLSLDSALILIWAAGAAALLVRLLSGVVTLHSWTRKARPVRSAVWQSALRQCGRANVRLLAHQKVTAPLSWGWLRPAILIGSDSDADPVNASAIVAHELAHVARADWPRLMCARLVVALFWFNPLMWLLERLFLNEVEEAADAEAVRTVQPARYAEALLTVASGRPVLLAANSIAAGPLARRIVRVLQARNFRPAARWKVAAVFAMLGFAAPVAALEFEPESSPTPSLPDPVAPTAILPQAPPSTMVAPAARTPATAERRWKTKMAMATLAEMKRSPTPLAMRRAIAPVRMARVMTVAAPAIAATPKIDTDALDAELEWAQAALEAQAQRTAELSARIADLAQRKAEVAMRNARADMARGAVSMEKGADNMLRGAESMRQEAGRLRDPAYRQRKIAEEAARGRHVTDRELVEAIPELEKGARDMVEGAADMRRGAQEMRESAAKQD